MQGNSVSVGGFGLPAMEDKKKHPSVPANYVTLVQLQERWLKEKERQEKEKQQRERREEEVKPKLADQKDSVGKQARPSNASKHRKSKASGSRRDEPGALAWKVVEEVVAVDGDKKADQQGQSPASKKMKKKKRTQLRRQNPNPAAVKDVGHKEGVEHAPPEGGDKEDSRERRSEESRGIRANGSDLDRTAEVETKFRDLSVNGGAEKRKSESRRAGGFHHHCGSREFRGYGAGRFGGRWRKPRDGHVVWVKKGEPFDGNAGRMRKLEGTAALPGKDSLVLVLVFVFFSFFLKNYSFCNVFVAF